MNKSFLNSTLLFICAVLFSCCHKDKISPVAPTKSTEKNILSFTFIGLPKGEIDQIKRTIQFNMSAGTNITALKPVIQVSDKATVNPPSGQAQDFTNKVTYTVTAEDGSKQDYTIRVQKEGMPTLLSSEKKITSFKFLGFNPEVSGFILSEESGIINAVVPNGTNLGALIPTIAVSEKAVVSPASGQIQNFTELVTYTVTAEDKSQSIYRVSVQQAPKIIDPLPEFTLEEPYYGTPILEAGSGFTIKGYSFGYQTPPASVKVFLYYNMQEFQASVLDVNINNIKIAIPNDIDIPDQSAEKKPICKIKVVIGSKTEYVHKDFNIVRQGAPYIKSFGAGTLGKDLLKVKPNQPFQIYGGSLGTDINKVSISCQSDQSGAIFNLVPFSISQNIIGVYAPSSFYDGTIRLNVKLGDKYSNDLYFTMEP